MINLGKVTTALSLSLSLSLCALAACGGKKADKADKKAGETAAAGSGSAQSINEADLFTGSTVTLPDAVAKLKFGMSKADAAAAAPDVVNAKTGYAVPGTIKDFDQVTIRPQFSKADRLWVISYELLEGQPAVKDWLTKKWGEPVVRKNSIGTPEYYWNTPAAGLRAELQQVASKSSIAFEAIAPRGPLLGSDPKHFAFDNPPLIGMAQADALKVLAPIQNGPATPRSDNPDVLIISLVPSESEYDTRDSIELHVKGTARSSAIRSGSAATKKISTRSQPSSSPCSARASSTIKRCIRTTRGRRRRAPNSAATRASPAPCGSAIAELAFVAGLVRRGRRHELDDVRAARPPIAKRRADARVGVTGQLREQLARRARPHSIPRSITDSPGLAG